MGSYATAEMVRDFRLAKPNWPGAERTWEVRGKTVYHQGAVFQFAEWLKRQPFNAYYCFFPYNRLATATLIEGGVVSNFGPPKAYRSRAGARAAARRGRANGLRQDLTRLKGFIVVEGGFAPWQSHDFPSPFLWGRGRTEFKLLCRDEDYDWNNPGRICHICSDTPVRMFDFTARRHVGRRAAWYLCRRCTAWAQAIGADETSLPAYNKERATKYILDLDTQAAHRAQQLRADAPARHKEKQQ